MKQYLSLTLLVGAFAVALMALFGDNTYNRLNSLNENIKYQQQSNAELENKVARLQSEIAALRFDDLELERRARKELGLARPNEIIFRFGSDLRSNNDLTANSGDMSADSNAELKDTISAADIADSKAAKPSKINSSEEIKKNNNSANKSALREP